MMQLKKYKVINKLIDIITVGGDLVDIGMLKNTIVIE